MCCDGPDTSGQVRQAEASENLGNRSLDLAERQYADSSDLQREFMDLVRVNSESDGELKDIQTELTLEQAQKRRDIFDPLEASLVLEAEGYDAPDRMRNEMGKADAAVVQAYDKANRGRQRDALRMGINPNSGKAMALAENGALELAKAAAGASTSAGERVKAKGFGMRMDAAGLGRNLATNQTAAADSAVRAGQSAVGGMQSGVDQGNRNFSATMGGFNAAGNAFSNAGSLYGRAAETEAANDPMSSVGKAVGLGAKIYSGGGCG